MPESISLGATVVDFERQEVRRGDQRWTLTAIELKLLNWLVEHPGRVVSRDDLQSEVWGYAPGVRTRAVDNTILRLRRKLEANPEEPVLLVSTRGGGYRLEIPPRSSAALPGEPSSFVGRSSVLEELAGELRDKGIVVLYGPGGMGKSRVALRLARQWPQALHVNLEQVSHGEDLEQAVGRSLGLQRVTPEQLDRALAGRGEALIVLDPFERLMGERQRLNRWRKAAPSLRWLVVSRVRWEEEAAFELPPLAPTEALTLLRERAEAVGAVGLADEELLHLSERLDRHPLALELTAARLGLLPPEELLRRLQVQAVPDRSLRAALDASWNLLTPQLQADLRRLVAFVGDFSAQAAEALLDGPDPIERLEALRAASWLWRRAGEAGIRLGFYEMIRAYLLAQGEDPTAVVRHRAWTLGLATECTQALKGSWEPKAAARLAAEIEEIVAAVDRAIVAAPEEGAQLLVALQQWIVDGRFALAPMLTRIDALIEACAASPLLPRLLWLQGSLLRLTGKSEQATAALFRARAGTTDPHLSGAIEGQIGNSALQAGRLDEAQAKYEEAIQILRPVTPLTAAVFSSNLGVILLRKGRYIEAERIWLSALADMGKQAAPANRGRVHALLADLLETRGEYEAATAHIEEAISLIREAGDQMTLSHLLANRSFYELNQERLAEASALAKEASMLAKSTGHVLIDILVQYILAGIAQEERRYGRALDLAFQGLRMAEDARLTQSEGMMRWQLGRTHLFLRRLDLAHEETRRALELLRKAGTQQRTLRVAALLATIEAERAEPDQGAALLTEWTAREHPVDQALLELARGQIARAKGDPAPIARALREADGLKSRSSDLRLAIRYLEQRS